MIIRSGRHKVGINGYSTCCRYRIEHMFSFITRKTTLRSSMAPRQCAGLRSRKLSNVSKVRHRMGDQYYLEILRASESPVQMQPVVSVAFAVVCTHSKIY
jgi:hypothetical protein